MSLLPLVRTLLCLGLLAAQGSSCNGGDAAPPPPATPDTAQTPKPAASNTPDKATPPSAEAKATFARARELFLAEESLQAAEELRKTVALAPDWAEARLQLGKLLLTLCSVRFSTATFDRGCLDQAVAELERACALDPRSAEAAYWTGRALGKVPRIPEAMAKLETARARDTNHGRARKGFGLLAAQEGDVVRSKEYLMRAREVLPNDDEVLLQLGMLLESDENLAEAKAAFLRARELNPAHPGPLTRLVWIYRRLGDETAAEQASAELTRLKEFGKRLTQATQRFEADRADSGACLEVAKLYQEIGMTATARSWAERALRLDANNAGASEFLKKQP